MHHRSYQSILPTHNKLLQQRWDKAYFQEHRRRVKTAFPIVSTAAPKVRSHVASKLKKQQRESERMEVVLRDNHTLMVNMENIMTRGGYVDHQNSYNHWSLNYNKRANELQRIQTENIKMLGRIQSREPNYSVSDWLKDRTEKERLIKMITAHPTQPTHSAKSSAKKRDPQSLLSLSSQAYEKSSSLDIEVSDSDTIASLERDKEIAVRKMSKISKSDLTEIKSFSKPPVAVKLVLEATSILFTHNVQSFPFLKELQDFVSFDKENIPSSVLEKLKPYIDNPELNSDRLKPVSFSIVGVMEWVRGVYQFGIITHKLKQLGVYPKQEPAQLEDTQPSPPPLPPTKDIKFKIEVSDSDTINSLEREREIVVRNMSKISKASITEIKSFCKPPVAVKSVLEASSILFTHNVQSFPFLKELQDFVSFDKENIPSSVLEKLKPYIDNPELNSDRLKPVSFSIVGVMEWVRGVYQFGIITHKLKQLGVYPKQEPAQLEDTQPSPPPLPPTKDIKFKIEVSDSDTINSLEREREIVVRNMSKISKASITEIKSFCKPPVAVKSVLEASSILFTHNVQSFPFLKELQDFVSFDKENIPSSVLEKLKPYIDNPELNSDRLKPVSFSIVGVMEWVRGVYQFGIITHKLKQLGVYPKQEPAQLEDTQSSPPPLPPTKDIKFKIEVSDTDTINSLEREREIVVRNMSKISKSDLTEIKSFSKPPVAVKLVLEATSILFTHNVQSFPFLKELQDFVSFDKENIPSSVLEKLKPYIDNPELNSDRLKPVSFSIVGVMEWVRGVYQFGIITHKLKQLGVYPKQEPAQLEDTHSFLPPLPPPMEKDSKFKIEVSDTDTINSLEREREIVVRNMSKISKSDLTEIKSFSKPPVAVKLVQEATSILFTHNVQSFPFLKELQDFVSFDKENIPFSVLKKLKPYIDNPELKSDRLKQVSASIDGVMEWVRGVYQFGIITHKLKQLGVYPKQEPAQLEDTQSFPPPLPPTKDSKFKIEVSDTDTINSLEREREIAVGNMSKISKSDLTEIKSFSNPPVAVKLVQEATSILFTHNVQSFPFLKELQDFVSFDKENIPFSVLKKLKPYIDNPELESDRLKRVSASIDGVMEWVRGVYQFGIITHKLKQLDAKAKQRDVTSDNQPY